jgi:predicted transposase YdaD
MFHIHDIRESRVYQEALSKGIDKGAAIVRLAAKNKSVDEIAVLLGIDVERIRQVLAKADRD